MNEIFEEVQNIIVDIADIPGEEITKESGIIDDLCLSSLEIMAIIGDIEVKYNIKISGEDLSTINTIDDLIQIVIKGRNNSQ